ncbi:MAG: hypothetical protein ONB48_05240 [candidate division KSB1 bacterium]|nr:hypothetical protein [candidate division KSB1 bacterium]MDZ7272952.1 hypothetical protein [candidate division KSB1 bacterium]MDZ7285056.1 hypothetical protein [candidate division KSB1 bacterium]MDZ7298088.1 hypothetical protein [candidate division KSB1 bacterium]MDZ7349279.1 hypothetical protein [candidate division KSB1 bacterium]
MKTRSHNFSVTAFELPAIGLALQKVSSIGQELWATSSQGTGHCRRRNISLDMAGKFGYFDRAQPGECGHICTFKIMLDATA